MANLSPFTAALDASIEAHAFSGVVSIRLQGEVLYERAAGQADRSNGIANSRDTRFGIASGMKFLTALAVGQLIAAGKLSLATRLQDCIAPRTSITSPSVGPGTNSRDPGTTWRSFRTSR